MLTHKLSNLLPLFPPRLKLSHTLQYPKVSFNLIKRPFKKFWLTIWEIMLNVFFSLYISWQGNIILKISSSRCEDIKTVTCHASMTCQDDMLTWHAGRQLGPKVTTLRWQAFCSCILWNCFKEQFSWNLDEQTNKLLLMPQLPVVSS